VAERPVALPPVSERALVMPIRQYLDGHQFDAEVVRVLGLAFELTRTALRPVDRDDLANELIAKKIIELAQRGERDPERLCDRVLADLRAS
jgi:hypothetical protein